MSQENTQNSGGSAADERPLQIRKIDVLGSLRAHMFVAAAVFALVAGAGLLVSLDKGAPRWAAEAAIRVSPTFARNLQEDNELRFNSNSDYRQFVQQQVVEIVGFDTTTAALEKLGSRRSLWQKPEESDRRAAERLMAALRVRAVPDTYLITVALEGDEPEGLDAIVNAVVDAYLEKYKAQQLYGADERVRALTERRAALQGEVEEKSAAQSAMALELGVSTFEEKFINPYDKLLDQSNEALAAATRRRIDAEAKLAALQAHQERINGLSVDSAALTIIANDRVLSDLSYPLLQRRSALFLQQQGLTPDHPGWQAAQREVTAIEAELKDLNAGALERTRARLLGDRASEAARERSAAQAELDEAVRAEQALDAQLATQQERVSAFATRYSEALGLRAEVDAARERMKSIDSRLSFLGLETEAPGFVRVSSLARPPEIPVEGKRKKLFALFLIAALGLAVALPLAIDFFDPRFHVPADVERVVGFAPLGWTLDGSVRSGAGLAQERLRRLALRIDRERGAHGTNCFVLTSVRRGAGNTTLTLDVAAALSRLGLRTLAVNADLGHADERYGFVEPAAASVDHASLEERIIAAQGGLPDRLSLHGQIGEDGRHRIEDMPAVAAALGELAKQYDVVLIDAAPLLLSSDTECLAQVANAVLLVIDAAGVQAAEVRQAAAQLERLATPVVGAVLHRVRDDHRTASLLAQLDPAADAAGDPLGRVGRWVWT